MQKEKIVELLKKLKLNGIERVEYVKRILNYDERVLESLLDFGNDIYNFQKALNVAYKYNETEEILEALSILKSAMKKEPYVFDRVYEVLINTDAIKAGIALEGAKAILEAKTEFQARYASWVLRNENAIQAGIALEGAKAILEAKEYFQALNASYVLTDENAIQGGIAFEGAKAILEVKEEFQAFYASYVLTNENAIKSGIALEIAKTVLTESSAKKAYYINLVARDKRIIQADIVLEAIKIISLSNEDELLDYLDYNENKIVGFIETKLGINIAPNNNGNPSKSDTKVRKLTI